MHDILFTNRGSFSKNKVAILLFSLLFVISNIQARQKLDMQVATDKHAKMKLLILLPSKYKDNFKDFTDVLIRDFTFSGQFDVCLKGYEALKSKVDIQKWGSQGFPLVIALSPSAKHIEWRLYNAVTGSMLKGKRYKTKGTVVRGWAHAVADMVWPELTGQPGIFSSKIAYCKQVDRNGKQNYKHVYIADFDGTHEQPLVDTPTVNVGPRFNNDPQNCLLFYSQFTNENIELMVSDMHRKHTSISTFDGVNMLPSFSPDGKKVAYCASKGTGNCQIYYFENKKLTQITDNEGNNISPALAEDGKKIYFCSDMHTCPSLYCFDLQTNELERITKGASSMSPSYCSKKNQLTYCRKIQGEYQVFVYDCFQKKHRQITTSAGHKSECCWSPCGNYILYGVEKDQKQYLETVNIVSKKPQRLVAVGNCSYPAWSPRYRMFPVVA